MVFLLENLNETIVNKSNTCNQFWHAHYFAMDLSGLQAFINVKFPKNSHNLKNLFYFIQVLFKKKKKL